jgi:hypothetical protein
MLRIACSSAPRTHIHYDDLAAIERRHLELDLELKEAYVTELSALLETAQHEIKSLQARSTLLSTIESSRWWRLRTRFDGLLQRHALWASIRRK